MTLHQFPALCDSCRRYHPECVRVHPRLRTGGRGPGARFGTALVVLCWECRRTPVWRCKYRVAAEHRGRARRVGV